MANKHWEKVRKIASALPGAVEGTSYGTPGFHIAKKLLCRLREDEKTLALRISMDERDMLMAQDPKIYFTTDHYQNYPAVLIDLPCVRVDALRALLERAWLEVAPAKLRKEREARAAKASGR